MIQKATIFAFLLCTTSLSWSQSVLLNESFDNGIPPSWERNDVDGNTPVEPVFDQAWVTLEDISQTGDSVAASTSYYSPAGTSNDFLITPSLPLGGFGNILTFEAKSIDAGYPESYKVVLSTTDKSPSSFTETIIDVDGESSFWESYTINLEDLGFTNQTVYIAFVNDTEDGYGMMLNNIKVTANDASDIKDVEAGQLKLYPNPVLTTEDLQFSSSFTSISSIQLLGLDGKLITTWQPLLNSGTLPLPAIEKGIYIVKVKAEEQVFSKKIVIQ